MITKENQLILRCPKSLMNEGKLATRISYILVGKPYYQHIYGYRFIFSESKDSSWMDILSAREVGSERLKKHFSDHNEEEDFIYFVLAIRPIRDVQQNHNLHNSLITLLGIEKWNSFFYYY